MVVCLAWMVGGEGSEYDYEYENDYEYDYEYEHDYEHENGNAALPIL